MSVDFTFNQYSNIATKTDLMRDRTYSILGLVSEVGEVASKEKKFMRDDKEIDKEELKYELGDILWYLNSYAEQNNLTLEEIAYANNYKLTSRMQRGKIHGDGDQR